MRRAARNAVSWGGIDLSRSYLARRLESGRQTGHFYESAFFVREDCFRNAVIREPVAQNREN